MDISTEISSIYKPLGLIDLAIVLMKVLFQDICKSKWNWHGLAPDNLLSQWQKISSGFEVVSCITLDHCYIYSDNLRGMSYIYCRAYGCCVYIRYDCTSRKICNILVTTKSGINPIKTQTIPRVELTCAYLLAKLIDSAIEVFKIVTRLVIFFVGQICL